MNAILNAILEASCNTWGKQATCSEVLAHLVMMWVENSGSYESDERKRMQIAICAYSELLLKFGEEAKIGDLLAKSRDDSVIHLPEAMRN